MAAVELKGVRFEQRHGKARVRVARVWRGRDDRSHSFAEWCVSISLLSGCLSAYSAADNSDVVATDTMKNTVYAKAKECSEEVSVENFAIFLGKHFTSYYKQVTAAIITIVEKPWERVHIDGQPHAHGFKLGSEKHTTEVTVEKCGTLRLTSGVEALSLLKTTKSGFEGFIRDKYTMLPETRERMLATEVTATWAYFYESLSKIPENPLYFTQRYGDVKKVLVDTFFGPPKEGVYSPSVQTTLYQMAQEVLGRFPDVSSVQLKMPNIHFLPVNLSSKNNVIVKFEDDVYLPTDEPHGSIQASLSRIQPKLGKSYSIQLVKETPKQCSPVKSLNLATVSTKSLNKKRSYAQLHLELGQSDFLLRTCSICGFKYACGDDGDEKVHKEFHKDYTHGIQFKGWNNERVVWLPLKECRRVVLVLDGDPPAHKKKVEKVVEMMEADLGSGCLLHKLCKVYLYIMQKRVVGCLIAELIKAAHRVLSSVEYSKSTNATNANNFKGLENNSKALEDEVMGAVLLEEEAAAATCGIRAIWVAPSMRRNQIATQLLDVARISFREGLKLGKSQLAFSNPTSSGKALAYRYFGTTSFLAYKTD